MIDFFTFFQQLLEVDADYIPEQLIVLCQLDG
jgi:hypothetical protein